KKRDWQAAGPPRRRCRPCLAERLRWCEAAECRWTSPTRQGATVHPPSNFAALGVPMLILARFKRWGLLAWRRLHKIQSGTNPTRTKIEVQRIDRPPMRGAGGTGLPVMQQEVPPEVKELLETHGLNGVPILLSTTSDLSLPGESRKHWLVATRE